MNTPPSPGPQAHYTFDDIKASAPPARPLEFPTPNVYRATRGPALVIHVETGQRQVLRGIIYKLPPPPNDPHSSHSSSSSRAAGASAPQSQQENYNGNNGPQYAYFPQKQLQEAIYGSVWVCAVLKRHYGPAMEEAAQAAGLPRNAKNGPYVWEVTRSRVTIKMMVWARIHRNRGRMLEDPVKEIAAMRLLGGQNNDHRRHHVLGCLEVLQDDDFLYAVMPFCSGGDLFGVVVQYAKESNDEIGMPEPVARFWFRQILKGLNFLQAKGVCHRDLSLENILVHEDNCFIIDMGMCLRVPYTDPKKTDCTTDVTAGTMRRLIKPQGTCGKRNYMSPEIFADNQPFDGFGIDLWAAGAILYIMLTGFPPYDQPSLADPRFAVIAEGNLVSQLEDWGVNLSKDAGDLMQRMLQYEPKHRMTLEQVMRHPWVTTGQIQPPPTRLQPWQQR